MGTLRSRRPSALRELIARAAAEHMNAAPRTLGSRRAGVFERTIPAS